MKNIFIVFFRDVQWFLTRFILEWFQTKWDGMCAWLMVFRSNHWDRTKWMITSNVIICSWLFKHYPRLYFELNEEHFIVFFRVIWWFLKEPGFFIYLFIYCFFLFFFFGWFKPSDLPTSVQRLLPLPWHSVGMHLVPYDFRMSPTIQDRQTNVRLWDSRSSPDSRTESLFFSTDPFQYVHHCMLSLILHLFLLDSKNRSR